MSELRWLLLAAGILLLAVIFWFSRREAAGKPLVPGDVLRRLPGLGSHESAEIRVSDSDSQSKALGPPQSTAPRRIVTVRLTARGNASFSGESLLVALRDAGLRHGKFGIFHMPHPDDEQSILFSAASLVEPGSFDLARMRAERYPGVSLFVALPGDGDGTAAFDAMLAAGRVLANALDGELLDENGSRLSVQRERYLREEVIRFLHDSSPV